MPDKCDPIRRQIAELRAEIKDLQAQLSKAAPTQKSGIARQIKTAQGKLTKKQTELTACAAIPRPRGQMTARSHNFQIRPEVEVIATGFTPKGAFTLTISHMPGKSGVIHRDHSFDGNGSFHLIEGFEIARVRAEVILPEIEITMRDSVSGQVAVAHLSPHPFVVRV